MVTESAQMLSTVHHIHQTSTPGFLSLLYKPCHQKHPCTLWAAESLDNYTWLWQHYHALSKEYTKRYGKQHAAYHKPITMSNGHVECLGPIIHPSLIPRNGFEKRGLTPFAIAMKQYPQCIVPGNAVESYRNYYRVAKKDFAKWSKTAPPAWF